MFQMACTDLHNLRSQPQQPGQGDDGQRGRGHHRQAPRGQYKYKYCVCVVCTVGVIKICSLVFRELLSLGCINLQNLCAHQ